ncbi:hypothetical protein PCL_06764 [Purpureocillium lilacinum]|uniref:DUF4396 domain-containing protein n=1 Tax=Purpureocillium lilacinum TaxID=33203 RepID=A0A2U3DU59_PURLI|nr:hypothetical protein Purlil1_358 [Purpureocillium lilacinum]PWI65793.1 hypothetical protein PCL_06764 [Purpureocillium lilacinum]
MASSFASPRTCARHVGALQSLGRARLQSRIVRHSFVQGRLACSKTPGPPCHDASRPGGAQQSSTASIASAAFWTSNATWRRATVNTFRCLVGCTAGDFSAMWFLQSSYPELGMEWVMAISMVSGLSTSMMLETVLLRLGRDRLSWKLAARTAAGMSLISMITMEAAENAVEYYLTGGQVSLDSPAFWVAGIVAMAAGFLAPLPYNYARLRRYGKGCH